MIKKTQYIFLFILLFLLLSPLLVFAQRCDPATQVCITPPIPISSPQQLIGTIIKAVLGIVGSLALAMFVYGGFIWMLAAGSAERVQKGKNVLVWATIGLIVIFTAYALVKFVFKGLGIE